MDSDHAKLQLATQLHKDWNPQLLIPNSKLKELCYTLYYTL